MQATKSKIAQTVLTERHFLYHVPSRNLYIPFKAFSRQEAQHKFINSEFAPYYGQAVLLTPDD